MPPSFCFEISGYTARVAAPDNAPARAIVYSVADGSAFAKYREAARGLGAAIVCLDCVDWNRELSPWPAKKCFKGGEDFAGGADEFLSCLEREIIPASERETPLAPDFRRFIMGYSLAGLFALYAMFKTDAFAGCASVSGSLWFDAFADFMASQPLARADASVYLSLGDSEENSRNPRLASVGARTREAYQILLTRAPRVIYEINPGGHFNDPDGRCLKALRWLLN